MKADNLWSLWTYQWIFPHMWKNRILLPKLFGPTVRKKCSTFEIQGQKTLNIVDLPVKKEDKLSTKTKPIEIKYIIIGKTPKSMPCSPIRLKSVLIQTKDIIGKTDDKSLDGITELIGVTWLHKIRWHGYTWRSFMYYISTILPTTTFSRIFVQYSFSSKGQLISKQNCRAITSPKKQTLDFYF